MSAVPDVPVNSWRRERARIPHFRADQFLAVACAEIVRAVRCPECKSAHPIDDVDPSLTSADYVPHIVGRCPSCDRRVVFGAPEDAAAADPETDVPTSSPRLLSLVTDVVRVLYNEATGSQAAWMFRPASVDLRQAPWAWIQVWASKEDAIRLPVRQGIVVDGPADLYPIGNRRCVYDERQWVWVEEEAADTPFVVG